MAFDGTLAKKAKQETILWPSEAPMWDPKNPKTLTINYKETMVKQLQYYKDFSAPYTIPELSPAASAFCDCPSCRRAQPGNVTIPPAQARQILARVIGLISDPMNWCQGRAHGFHGSKCLGQHLIDETKALTGEDNSRGIVRAWGDILNVMYVAEYNDHNPHAVVLQRCQDILATL